MDKNKMEDGLRGQDKQQADLRDPYTRELPEGLRRERKGPLSPSTGRRPPAAKDREAS